MSASACGSDSGSQKDPTGPNAGPSSPKKDAPKPEPQPRGSDTLHSGPTEQHIRDQNVHRPDMTIDNCLANYGSVEEFYASSSAGPSDPSTAPSGEAPQAFADPLAGFDATFPQPSIGPHSTTPVADPSQETFASQPFFESEGFELTTDGFTAEDWGDFFDFALAEVDGLVGPSTEGAAAASTSTSSEFPVDAQPAAASGSTTDSLLQVPMPAPASSTSTSSNAADIVQDRCQTEDPPSPSPLAHRAGTMFFYPNGMTTGMPGLMPEDKVGDDQPNTTTHVLAPQDPVPRAANDVNGSTSETSNGPLRDANLAATSSMSNVQVAPQVATNAPTFAGISTHPQTTLVSSQLATTQDNKSASGSAAAQPSSPWVPMLPEEWGGIGAPLLNVTGQPFIPPPANAGSYYAPQDTSSVSTHTTNAVHPGPQAPITPSLQTLPRISAPVNVSSNSFGMTRSAKLEVMEPAAISMPSNPTTSFTGTLCLPPTNFNVNSQLRQSVPPQQVPATRHMAQLAANSGSAPTYSAGPSSQPAQATAAGSVSSQSQTLPGDCTKLTNEITQALRLLPTMMQMATNVNAQSQLSRQPSQQYSGLQANNVHLQPPVLSLNGAARNVTSAANYGTLASQANNVQFQAPMHSLNGSAPNGTSTNYGMPAPQVNNVHLQAPMHSLNSSAPNGTSMSYGMPATQINNVCPQAPMHSLNGSAPNGTSMSYGVPAHQANNVHPQALMHSLNGSAPNGTSMSYGVPAHQANNVHPRPPPQPMSASAPNGTSTNYGMLAPTPLIGQRPVPSNVSQQYQQYPSHQQPQRSGFLPPPAVATPTPPQLFNAASNNVHVPQGPNSTHYRSHNIAVRQWIPHPSQAPHLPNGSRRDTVVDARDVRQMMAMGQITPLGGPVNGHVAQQGAVAAALSGYTPSPALSTATAAPSGHRPSAQIQYQTAAVQSGMRAPTGVPRPVPLGPGSILNTPFVPVVQGPVKHQAQAGMAPTMAPSVGNVQQGRPVRSIPHNANGYPRANGSSQLLDNWSEGDGQMAAQRYAAHVQLFNRLVQEPNQPENGGQPQGRIATSSLRQPLKRAQGEFEDQDDEASGRSQ
ncbi:hypothetical protein MD484_g1589, partial [Candolleomyces efflorescens]